MAASDTGLPCAEGLVSALMRILLLSHGLPPESVGGVQQHVMGLAGALIAQGHEVHIFTRATLPGTPQGGRGGAATARRP